MANALLLLFGIIVYQGCSKAAPSENIHSIITGLEEDVTLNSESIIEQHQDNGASQNQRQKRFYDYLGLDYPSIYDFPTLPYSSQPHYTKRDGSQNTGIYGSDDALNLIFRRLQDVLKDVRYQRRPAHTPYPAYIPLVYIPQFNCGCNNQGTAPPVNDRNQPATSETPPSEATTSGTTNVTLDNRGSFNDKRQNWGIVTTKPDLSNSANQGDGSRPINFDPIPPEEPMDVEAPPVDHGTIQAGAEPGETRRQGSSRPQVPVTTPAPNYLPNRPTVRSESPVSSSERFKPVLCDGAILICCSMNPITSKCFESYGCEDPKIYGNAPCDPKVQLLVTNKFRDYQLRRAG
ncbi:uncharacterized protein LOC112042846 [Bicyclus anynana]|uniref:Uncharacterized protein LOC112042846 n=1 Tax=Bicyclus anynana TaxID=110368 RepID=A0A6J1MTH2_BICAN|nr:uncharacterized protein LOC112042846 [Bicyclus anynana]